MSDLRKQLTDEQLKTIETAKVMTFMFDSLFKIKPPKKQEEVLVEKPLTFNELMKQGGI